MRKEFFEKHFYNAKFETEITQLKTFDVRKYIKTF